MLSKTEAESFRANVFLLACHVGLRSAARHYNLKESRVTKWAQRYNWQIGKFRPNASNASLSSDVATPLEAFGKLMTVEGDRTRVAMARTSRRAFEHADTVTDEQLHELPRAVALEKHGRNASIAHNWNQAAANVAVQVNVPLPSAEEREEMRAIDAKLDEIAKRLR